jgi:hypothetical protein
VKLFRHYFSFFVYLVSLYISLPASRVVVNLSRIHQNIIFTRDKVYFLNGIAYDFYSIGELNNHSKVSAQWKTFPLPNEQLPPNIIPWKPHHHASKQTTSTSIPSGQQTSTGLAFVDHIYITSTPNLTDRQANLERMFAQYQITNYEWRMKWSRDTCNSPQNKEEVYKKANLRERTIGKINSFS